MQNSINLQPFDIVIVKSLPGYTQQRTVLVQGEVKSSGRYGLINSRERISDIIQRAGGFKASADSNSITIRRSTKSNLTRWRKRRNFFKEFWILTRIVLLKIKCLQEELYKSYDLISVDLGTALAHPESPENLTLDDGDVLTINRSTNLVRISGEVYFPTIVAYRANKNLKYYVQQAGNFTAHARKTGALVIYPDAIISVKHFLCFKSYPSVTPRSEIYVPQKEKNNRTRLSITELALLISSLGILVNVIKL